MNKALLLILSLLFSQSLLASEPVSKSFWGAIAIGGHDTVAYHQPDNQQAHTTTKGEKKFLVEWNDARWYFASKASADKFAADPARYKPEYNGHCANALSLGEGLIQTDGTVWEFFGDQLHLFYAERGRQRWLNGDWKSYKQQANTAWNTLKNE